MVDKVSEAKRVEVLVDGTHRAAALEELLAPKLSVQATLDSDDATYTVKFDAAKWFEQASDEEILDLYKIGWSGDYEADEVAHFVEDEDKEVKEFFSYCDRKDTGFEVSVNEYEALRWLHANRPKVEKEILKRLQEKA